MFRLLPDLSSRHCEPEMMDDPGLDPLAHHQALASRLRMQSQLANLEQVTNSRLETMARQEQMDQMMGSSPEQLEDMRMEAQFSNDLTFIDQSSGAGGESGREEEEEEEEEEAFKTAYTSVYLPPQMRGPGAREQYIHRQVCVLLQ